MLRLKIKEVLETQGKKSPQNWLIQYCNLTFAKAYNLVNNKQKSIAFEDLSKMCRELDCTPNDLFWWDNSSKMPLKEWHPCISKLVKPSQNSNWVKEIEELDPARVEILKQQMALLKQEKENEAKMIKKEVVNNQLMETADAKLGETVNKTEDSEI